MTWKHNMESTFVIAIAIMLALGIQFAQGYTGPLDLHQRFGQYGGASFAMGATQYPRIVDDSEGYALKLAHPTRTVASQFWSIDEYLYSIVPPETVVSVSAVAFDHTSSNVFQFTDKYHPAITSDPEIILKLDPDLLIVSSDARADFTQLLRVAGTPIFRMFTEYFSLDDVRRTIRLVGYLTGRDSEAARVDQEFAATIQKAKSRKPEGLAAPRILEYSGGYTAGDQTMFDDVVRTLGGVNLATEHGIHSYAALNSEQIIRWDPEWIVSGAARGSTDLVLKKLMSDPAIALTTAARNGHVVVLDNNVFFPMSPFTALLLDALGDALYGKPESSKG